MKLFAMPDYGYYSFELIYEFDVICLIATVP